jgi:tape measure domain-containing protein
MARIGADIGGLERGLQQAERRIRGFAGSMNSVGTKLSFGLSAPLAGLAAAAVRSATQMDSLKRGLTAVAGSAAEADRQLGRLREIAKLPGLGRVEAIEASTQLQAAGLSAEMAERSLLAFGNALATVGKGKAELAGVTTALTQITAKGKVTAEEINQIAERVPQIRVAMQAAFGTANTEALQKMGLTARQFIEGINAELLKIPRVTGGAQTAFENLGDVVSEALENIGNNILPTLMPMVEKATNALVNLTKQFAALSPEVRRTILAVTGLVALSGPTLLFLGQFTAAARTLGLTIPVVLASLRTVVAFLGGPWGIALAAAAALVVANWDTISRTISDWSAEVVPLLQGTWASIHADATPAMDIFKETILGTFRDIRDEAKPILQQLGDSISDFVKKRVAPVLNKIAPAPGSGLAGWVMGHVKAAKGELVDLQAVYQEVFKDIAAPMGYAAPAERRERSEPGKRKLTDLDRQALALMRELRGETARLNMIRAGEDQITQQLADRFPLLSRARRDELAVVLRQIEAAEKQAQGLETYRNKLQQIYAETRFQRGDKLALLRHENPTLNDQQLRSLQAASAALGKAKNDTLALAEAERKRKDILRSLKQELEGRWRQREALIPEETFGGPRALKVVGEMQAAGLKLADVLGIVSFAAKDLRLKFFDLSGEQQKLVEDNYWQQQTLDTLGGSLERFRTAAERKIELHRETERRLQNERDATFEATQAIENMRKAMAATVTDPIWEKFHKELERISTETKQNADKIANALESIAESTKTAFQRAFENVKGGLGGMIKSVIDGVKQMLVSIAAEYLAAQATNAILGALGGVLGMAFPKVGSRLGDATARQHGGPISAGRPYLVGERGPEVIMPRRSGHVVPNSQLAGAGGHTFNITVNGGMDQTGTRNLKAAIVDALNEAERQRKRNG